MPCRARHPGCGLLSDAQDLDALEPGLSAGTESEREDAGRAVGATVLGDFTAVSTMDNARGQAPARLDAAGFWQIWQRFDKEGESGHLSA